jgi:hypothetical protein
MADIGIRINNAKAFRLAEKNKDFQLFLGELQHEMLKQEAALSARAFIKFSPPIPEGGGVGDKTPAYKQGEIAVERDIRSLVAPRSATLASAVNDLYGSRSDFEEWKAKRLTKNSGRIINAIHADTNIERAYKMAQNIFGNANTGGRILGDISELQELHNKQRLMYRGRITRKGGPSQDIKQKPYFAEPRLITKYINDIKKHVGFLQSGWLRVIHKIGTVKLRGQYLSSGTKGISSRLYKLTGDGNVRMTTGSRGFVFNINATATISNPIGNINNVAEEAAVRAQVIKYRLNQLASRPYNKYLSNAISRYNSGALKV